MNVEQRDRTRTREHAAHFTERCQRIITSEAGGTLVFPLLEHEAAQPSTPPARTLDVTINELFLRQPPDGWRSTEFLAVVAATITPAGDSIDPITLTYFIAPEELRRHAALVPSG